MLSLVTRRLIRLVIVLAGVSLVTFAILQVSGDPIALMMPEAPEADRAVLRQSMGFNDPLPVQFARFLGNIVRGDFGHSFFHREPALPLVLARMPTTLLLTARAKGVSEWFVVCRHALTNAALPLVTVAGLQFGLLLGGAIITETVFAVPGLGRLIVGAIRQLDFPIVQAGVFVIALIVVLVNFAVDMLYLYLNPQIRVR